MGKSVARLSVMMLRVFMGLAGCWRVDGERPSCRRAAEQRDELAPLHSITSSARANRGSEKLRPRVPAVFRLITN
jgi:hypothetical protein